MRVFSCWGSQCRLCIIHLPWMYLLHVFHSWSNELFPKDENVSVWVWGWEFFLSSPSPTACGPEVLKAQIIFRFPQIICLCCVGPPISRKRKKEPSNFPNNKNLFWKCLFKHKSLQHTQNENTSVRHCIHYFHTKPCEPGLNATFQWRHFIYLFISYFYILANKKIFT